MANIVRQAANTVQRRPSRTRRRARATLPRRRLKFEPRSNFCLIQPPSPFPITPLRGKLDARTTIWLIQLSPKCIVCLASIELSCPKWPKIEEISKYLSNAYASCSIAPNVSLFRFFFVKRSDLFGLRMNERIASNGSVKDIRPPAVPKRLIKLNQIDTNCQC